MMLAYNAWCRDDQLFDLREEFVNYFSIFKKLFFILKFNFLSFFVGLYAEMKHGVQDQDILIEQQIATIVDEYKMLEKKSTQIDVIILL